MVVYGNYNTAVREDNFHYARTRVIAIENTHNVHYGNPLPVAWIDALGAFCHTKGLALHVDGARLMNASVAQNVSPKLIMASVDSVR